MTYRILMAASVPLASPWNGADKNLARMLVHGDRSNHFMVHTGPGEAWDPRRVEPVLARAAGSLPTRAQKLRQLTFLARHGGSADLLHVVASLYAPSRYAGPALRLVSRALGKPLVHTIPSAGEGRFARRDYFGDATVTVSEHARRRLEGAGVPGVFRVYPPLDMERLTAGGTEAAERLRRKYALGERAVLYAAHFGPGSGIPEAIEAFGRLRRRGFEDAVLVLACRAHAWQDAREERRAVMKRAVEAGVGDRVRVLGDVEDMPALIRACALTALVPERLEGKMDLPLVALESLALGRPVVLTDQPPINEALLGGGHAVPHNDPAALARSMEQLLSSPALRESLAREGQREVLAKCLPERVAQSYAAVYERALQSRAGASATGWPLRRPRRCESR